MLVLTRKIGERIVINEQIVLQVVAINGNRVRLGIQAPSGCRILREELLPTDTEPSALEEVPAHS
jgi:carbon storage regulator